MYIADKDKSGYYSVCFLLRYVYCFLVFLWLGGKQRGETKEEECVIDIFKKKKILLPSTESYYTRRTLWFLFLKENTASLSFFQIIRMEWNSRERLESWTVTQKRVTDSHDVRLLSSLQDGATHVTKQMPASPLFQSGRSEWKVSNPSYLDSRNTSQICMN